MARYVLMLLLLPLLKKALRRTTGDPMKASPSAVAARITPTTSESRPSPTPDDKPIGLAEPPSECAHDQGVHVGDVNMTKMEIARRFRSQCRKCYVWMWFDVTPVLDAAPTPSTFPKQDSSPSAPQLIRAPSRSPAFHEHDWLDIACVFTAPGKSTPFRGCVCGAKMWGDQVLVPAASNANWRKDTPG